MIVLCGLNDTQSWRGETYATTMRPIEGIPSIECLRPTHALVHGYKYWGESEQWYTDGYRELLRRRWPAVKAWLDSLSPTVDLTLVCYCPPKSSGAFCHRQLIAQLLARWRPDIPLDVH